MGKITINGQQYQKPNTHHSQRVPELMRKMTLRKQWLLWDSNDEVDVVPVGFEYHVYDKLAAMFEPDYSQLGHIYIDNDLLGIWLLGKGGKFYAVQCVDSTKTQRIYGTFCNVIDASNAAFLMFGNEPTLELFLSENQFKSNKQLVGLLRGELLQGRPLF